MKTKLLLFFAIVLTAFNVNAQTIALVGEAAGGWPGDPGNPGPIDVHQMTSTDGINWTLNAVTLTTAASGGGVKFRQDNSWTTNWGNAAFPMGTGTAGGANILCIAGTYDVTFNSTTGEYNFSGGTPIPVVKLVGTAVAGGTADMTTLDAVTFTTTAVLTAGLAQFTIDGSAVGDTGWPTGSVSDPSLFIPVVAGNYVVTLNTGTGEYSFVPVPVFHTVAIVGAGAGGWPTGAPGEIDAHPMTTTDGVAYTLNGITLTAEAIKFREDNAWTTSYGGGSFPTGPTTPGDNIAVTAAGTYDATFNRTTAAYTFSIPTIAIVGSGAGGWPTGAVGEIDINQLTSTDGGLTYILNGVTFTDGFAKYRANNAWSMNWGGASLSSALVPNGADIPTTAGFYNISFNRVSGQSTITPGLSTSSFSANNFRVFPNPASSNWNLVSASDAITSVQVTDVLGKVILTQTVNATSATIDASALHTGIYFAKVTTTNESGTIRLVKN
jgi:starch-binding outer membrane protein SusE/F